MEDLKKWLEARIQSSLKPRPDELRQMFASVNNRLAISNFLNNEDVRKLFVYVEPPRKMCASSVPVKVFYSKSVFFFKKTLGVKLTKQNIDDEVLFMECGQDVLNHLSLATREVFMPLFCTDTVETCHPSANGDKVMDGLHRLVAALDATAGSDKGEVALAMPSIEILANAAENPNRQMAVLRVLENTVVAWTKQIDKILKQNPVADLYKDYGPHPGPLDEVELWMLRRAKLASICSQLRSPVALDVFQNLANTNSAYVKPFKAILVNVTEAQEETNENLVFLKTLGLWIEKLHVCLDPHEMTRLFFPLVHTLLLVWKNSVYYHQLQNFRNFLCLICNAVVNGARKIIGEDILASPAESHQKLKATLRACATFRGVYLDYREKAVEINRQNIQDLNDKQVQRTSEGHVLYSSKLRKHKNFDSLLDKPPEELPSKEDKLKADSVWPARNSKEFERLNLFMGRCTDVMELVETIQHFDLLSNVAAVGGAGNPDLDNLVREIYEKYRVAIDRFLSAVSPNSLIDDGNTCFTPAFFSFRSVIKDLEIKLAGVLQQSFRGCPTTDDRLRLFDVFEGISSRILVQTMLKDELTLLVVCFTEEVENVHKMFTAEQETPPPHKNMPTIVSRLLWVYGMKQRIKIPLKRVQKICAQSFDERISRKLEDIYSETMHSLEKYEAKSISDWQERLPTNLTDKLDQPLLISDDPISEEDIHPMSISVNYDPQLLLLLREIYYLSHDPLNIDLSSSVVQLVGSMDFTKLRTMSSRLETIVSKYNGVMKNVNKYELALFERTLSKISQLFKLGLTDFTWNAEETADFIEAANALVCVDLYKNLEEVQTNFQSILDITRLWSQHVLDVFTSRDSTASYSIDKLQDMQIKLNSHFESSTRAAGFEIHKLLGKSFESVEISEASPAWLDYMAYIDMVILEGLKSATLTSLHSMCTEFEAQVEKIPILTIRMELIQSQVTFTPPLDRTTTSTSLQEIITQWLNDFLARGSFISTIISKGSYQDYIEADEQVQQMIVQIENSLEGTTSNCKELVSTFENYSHLWKRNIKQDFQEFLDAKNLEIYSFTKTRSLDGVVTPSSSSRFGSRLSSVELGEAERSFLSLPPVPNITFCRPNLDDFEAKINSYKEARDSVFEMADYEDHHWIRVDMQPMKYLIQAYAKLWMWTFTQYLSVQVTKLLTGLDQFLLDIEPEIEGITGEERDMAAFTKAIRTFHKVTAMQKEMEGKLTALKRTIVLLAKYEHSLPERTQQLSETIASRWTNLKSKVSQAKQKIAPRILEEADYISKELEAFLEKTNQFYDELRSSEVYQYSCSASFAFSILDQFTERVKSLEDDAQDLMELQEFLETSVLDFKILKEYHRELTNLRHVWHRVQITTERHNEWKRKKWQKINTEQLRHETAQQIDDNSKELKQDTFQWDVTNGLHQSIVLIQTHLPLIDYLNNPAMRPRHWKVLMRQTDGLINVDGDNLKNMTFGEFLGLGLDNHLKSVQSVVEKAMLDAKIERSLKTYEEIWLSKIFELQVHARSQLVALATVEGQENTNETNRSSHSVTSGKQTPPGGVLVGGKPQGASTTSLPNWLLDTANETGPVQLLANTELIFVELENHQSSLMILQRDDNAGSFSDEVSHWQKVLQMIEVTLTQWMDVQTKWLEMEEIYSRPEIAVLLPIESEQFGKLNQEFWQLMKATERNNNVLQCCQREGIQFVLESLNLSLEQCWKSLTLFLDDYCKRFPRFYFLSTEDIFHIVCSGFDLENMNRFIGKLFENIKELVFERTENDDRCVYKITAVNSETYERLDLLESVFCDGQVEVWLIKLMTAISNSLKHQLTSPGTSGSVDGERTEEDTNVVVQEPVSSDREEILKLLTLATEVVHLKTWIHSTFGVENALKNLANGNQDAIQNAVDDVNNNLKSAISLFGDEQSMGEGGIHTPNQLKKLESFIQMIRHKQDLLERLQRKYRKFGQLSENDFLWMSQLQYSLHQETGEVSVKCLNSSFEYGFEYIGSAQRQIISPQMEKTFFSLTQAVTCFSAGLCISPGYTQQVEVISELSRCLGRPFFTFSCTDATNYSRLHNTLKGLATAGAWVCFSQVDILRPEVMGTLSQMLLGIMSALRAKQSSVSFFEAEYHLDHNGSCFATIDSRIKISSSDPKKPLCIPSAATRLPQSFLTLFRAASFVAPSTRMVLETILLSKGFGGDQICDQMSKKLTALLGMVEHLLEVNSSVKSDVTDLLRCIMNVSAEKLHNHQFSNQGNSPELNVNIIIVTSYEILSRYVDGAVLLSLIRKLWPTTDVAEIIKSQPSTGLFAKDFCVTPPLIGSDSQNCCFPEYISRNRCRVVEPSDHILLAANRLGLVLTPEFYSHVCQLEQQSQVNRTVIVCGPAGCGKSAIIKTYVQAEIERGRRVARETIFTKSCKSEDLFGHFDLQNKEWRDGRLVHVLDRLLSFHRKDDSAVLHLDGMLDVQQYEVMHSIFETGGCVVLQNNNRLALPSNLHIFWETDSMSNLSPSTISNVSIVSISSTDQIWRLVLNSWLFNQQENEQEFLETLFNRYLPKTISYFTKIRRASERQQASTGRLVSQTEENLVRTLTALLQASWKEKKSELYFVYCCIWSFGGTLTVEAQETFSCWWKATFHEFVGYPENGSIFDLKVDEERGKFVFWSEATDAQNYICLPDDIKDHFVRTACNENLLYLMKLLSHDAHHPLMLIGENGCGKTALINEYIKSHVGVDDGDLFIHLKGLRFTTAELLQDKIMEKMQWKYGSAYYPKSGHKLLVVIDDVGQCQMDDFHSRSAVELIRQHLDQGWCHSSKESKRCRMNSLKYITSYNHTLTDSDSQLGSRFLRQFAILACHAPKDEELHTIYYSMLRKHFCNRPSSPLTIKTGDRSKNMQIDEEILLRAHMEEQQRFLFDVLSLVVQVTLEVHNKVRSMFLPTAERCHYLFTAKDLGVIFKNLCLSLQPGCNHESLLLLWEHECHWVYGHRLVSDIDSNRFHQTFVRAIQKNFTKEEHIQLLTASDKPVFSNMVEHISGLVTAGNIMGYNDPNLTEADLRTDLYRPVNNINKLRSLLLQALFEYNKENPKIKIALYRNTIEQICRLSRVMSSPPDLAHMILVAEGDPGRSADVATLAAHLSGFTIFKTKPNSSSTNRLTDFKADIANAFVMAGVKHKKLLMLLEEEEVLDEDMFVYLAEFLLTGSISSLYTFEEQTTIVNSIRTEVTQAGLSYTREIAWSYFLNSVKMNTRLCYIVSGGGVKFQRMVRRNINFIKSVNLFWLPHWTKRQLINCAAYHLREVPWLDRIQSENVSYLLATMHMVIRQQDKKKHMSGLYGHLTNLTYEKFIERFISLANEKRHELIQVHEEYTKMMDKIYQENQLTAKLLKDLEHEKVVLSEQKTGTINLLSQIGQDTAIAEQQMKLVKGQIEQIRQLKMLLPEYQVAHERAVYKTVAIVADTKNIVKDISLEGLTNLRSTQKPTEDVEHLLAAIIIILKGPQADLTWLKGAKRQMANLQRFVEELMSFDENAMPESTLALIETYIKKPSMNADHLEQTTGNPACTSLCNWVKGVARYHRMMTSKVKPLHIKVEKTSKDIDKAEQKMRSLESKKKALETRLLDLAKAFEEATIDKMDQLEKTIQMQTAVDRAADLRQILVKEHKRIHQVIESFPIREVCLPGASSVLAAFATYLGPYHYRFRNEMLTIHWPQCLRERGIPLVIDSIDPSRGRVVDWSMDGLVTNESESSRLSYEEGLLQNEQMLQDYEAARLKQTELQREDEVENNGSAENNLETFDRASEYSINEEEDEEEDDEEDVYLAAESSETDILYVTPVITSAQYKRYIRSLVKHLLGEQKVLELSNKGFSDSQMENLAMVMTSWQRVPMLVDPDGSGLSCIEAVISRVEQPIVIDMQNRSPDFATRLEKCVVEGHPVVLHNFTEHVDNLLTPLIRHCLARINDNSLKEEYRMITFNGRQMLCHPEFQLFMFTSNSRPHFSPTLASTTLLTNFDFSYENLVNDFSERAFAILRPDLFSECCKIRTVLCQLVEELKNLRSRFSLRFMVGAGDNSMFGEEDVLAITDMAHHSEKILEKIQEAKNAEIQLNNLKINLFPLARRATELFCILRSLAVIHREYQFSLNIFNNLFDEALGGKSPSDFGIHQTEKRDSEDGTDHLEGKKVEKFPSDGIEYSSFLDDSIKQLTEKITALTYHAVIPSLYKKDRLVLTTLIHICVGNEMQKVTEEELAFLIHGDFDCDVHLTLKDFDSNASIVPDWLPTNKWNDILSASVLPGSLYGICARIADQSEAWKKWYDSDTPEHLELPTAGSQTSIDDSEGNVHNDSTQPDSLSDFHKLVLIRLLRPDRFHFAMSSYNSRHLAFDPNQFQTSSADFLLKLVRESNVGLLVLLPLSSDENDNLQFPNVEQMQSAVASIQQLSKARGIETKLEVCGDGLDMGVIRELDSTEHGKRWVVLQNLHNMSGSDVNLLSQHLHQSMGSPDNPDRKDLIWATLTPSENIPLELLQCFHPISWDGIQQLAFSLGENFGSLVESSSITDSHFQKMLSTAIITSLQAIPDSTWDQISTIPQEHRPLVLGLAVINGLLISKQSFGTRGLNQFYPLDCGLYLDQALQVLVKIACMECQTADIVSLTLEGVKSIYVDLMVTIEDKKCTEYLMDKVLRSACDGNNILVGNITIAVPPSNIDAREYAMWLEVKLADSSTLDGIGLPSNVVRNINQATGFDFAQNLERVYVAQGQDVLDLQKVDHQKLNMLRLRTILDHLRKDLPPLLELGDSSCDGYWDGGSNSAHLASGVENSTVSLNHILLQECSWFNGLLRRIRHDISNIHKCLLGGKDTIAKSLQMMAQNIFEEIVPIEWVHVNHQHHTHSLMSWKNSLKKSYDQLKSWMESHHMTDPSSLLPVNWLGGLTNPEAILYALKFHKAIEENCDIDEVVLSCSINSSEDRTAPLDSLVLTGLYIQGAAWDPTNNCLTESRHDMNHLPDITVQPMLSSKVVQDGDYYSCPVFINGSRKILIDYLPLKCSESVEKWIMAGVAIILDEGTADILPRQAATLFKVPKPTLRKVSRSYQPDDVLPLLEIIKNHDTSHVTTERSVSTRSQISFRGTTSPAPALPVQLQLKRESPLDPEKRKSPQKYDDRNSEIGLNNGMKDDKAETIFVSTDEKELNFERMNFDEKMKSGQEAEPNLKENDETGEYVRDNAADVDVNRSAHVAEDRQDDAEDGDTDDDEYDDDDQYVENPGVVANADNLNKNLELDSSETSEDDTPEDN